MGYGNFNTYGLPATSNLFTVNGENDMDPYLNLNNSGATNLTLGKNEVEEATVISNAYSGQYGQQAGAQVNYVTKSGTNQFHGNAEYWWTGRAMDANDWFNNLYRHPASVRQQQRVGRFHRWTDQEGQAVLLRRHRRHSLHRSFVHRQFFPTHRAFATATLANFAAVDPAFAGLYQQDVQPVSDSSWLRQWQVLQRAW